MKRVIFAVVGDASQQGQVRQAHEADADLSGAARGARHLFVREVGDVDHVVEEAHRVGDGVAERLPVELAAVAREDGELDRAEHTALAREERLLAAGVRRADRAEVGRGVGRLDRVEEQQARLAARDDGLGDVAQQRIGAHGAGLGCGGVAELEALAARRGAQERFGQAKREPHPAEPFGLAARRAHEVADVRMADLEDGQVRARPPAGAAVHLGRVREELDEGERAGRATAGAMNGRARGPQVREVHARASGTLLDQGRARQRGVDRRERVLRLEHVAGRQIPRAPGVRQDGDAREEPLALHHLGVAAGDPRALVRGLGLGHGSGHALRDRREVALARRGRQRAQHRGLRLTHLGVDLFAHATRLGIADPCPLE
jgi:hypothetical protein